MAKRVIKVKEIVEDIKAGVIYVSLLDKYQLTPKDFRHVFKQLMNTGVIEPHHLRASVPTTGEKDASGETFFDWTNRRFERKEVDFPVPIYEMEYPHIKGSILNVSKLGVGTKGLKAVVGQLMTLTIPGSESLLYDRVEFEAICRWIRRQYDEEDYIGGFEVLLFYDGSLEDFLDQIASLSTEQRRTIIRRP